MVLSVSERTFNQEVLASPIPVLVNFWAPWCGLCIRIKPVLQQFQLHCEQPIKLVAINADDNFKLANQFKLTTLPTLILMENGEIVGRIDSVRGGNDLQRELENLRLSYIKCQQNYTQKLTDAIARDGVCHSLA